MRLRHILALASIPILSKESVKNDEFKLVNVQIFVRHGARTPIHCIDSNTSDHTVKWRPSIHETAQLLNKFNFKLLDVDSREELNPQISLNSPDEYELDGGALSGQLTTVGQKEMYEFGHKLRKKYVEELSFISVDEIENLYIRSSRMKRTINSAKCLLAGFYTSADQVCIPDKPIEIYSSHSATEILYPNGILCPFLKLQKLKGIKHNMKQPDFLATKMLLRKIVNVKSLKRKSEQAYENSMEATNDVECSLYHVRDEYRARKHHGMAIPQEINSLLPLLDYQSSEEMICELLGSKSFTKDDLRLVVGPLISVIFNNIKQVKYCNEQVDAKPTKCQIYVAHDTTLIPLLLSLGAFNGEWPKFGEHLIFELYQDKKKGYWLKIIYSDKPLVIKQMGATEENPMIPWKLFENHMKPYLFQGLENYCKHCRHKMNQNDFEIIQSRMF